MLMRYLSSAQSHDRRQLSKRATLSEHVVCRLKLLYDGSLLCLAFVVLSVPDFIMYINVCCCAFLLFVDV